MSISLYTCMHRPQNVRYVHRSDSVPFHGLRGAAEISGYLTHLSALQPTAHGVLQALGLKLHSNHIMQPIKDTDQIVGQASLLKGLS